MGNKDLIDWLVSFEEKNKYGVEVTKEGWERQSKASQARNFDSAPLRNGRFLMFAFAYDAGFKVKEISDHFGISLENVRWRIKRGKSIILCRDVYNIKESIDAARSL